jgi:tetratricopeptide (TPR) repeat protein
MKALALAVTLSLTLAIAAIAQDSKPSPKSNGASRQPAEAAANIDVAAIQKKIDEFSEAIKREPKNDLFYAARGQGYQRLKKFDLALADLNRAIELNSSKQGYFHVRGHIYVDLKRYREAFTDYSKAIACGAPTHNLYLKQGQAAILVGDSDSAYIAAKNAQKFKDDDLETLVLLGSAEQRKGLYQDSLKHLNRAIEINPADGGAFSIRGDTYVKLGQTELAKQDKARAKQLGYRY